MKKIKIYLKLGVVLFGFSISSLSCQKDDDLSKDTTNSQLEFKRDLITKSQVSKNKKVNSIIQALPKTNTLLTNNFNTQARTVYNEEYDFYINDEKAYHITYGNYDSYTFAIHRSQDNGLVENLILSKQLDGSYKSSIVSYNLNETEKQSIKNGTIPSGIENKMSIQPLSRGTDARIIQIGSSGIYYQEGSDGCIRPTFTDIDTPDGPSPVFSGWTPAGCPQGFVTSIDTGADTSNPNGGGEGITTPNVPSYTNPGTPNIGNPYGSPSTGGAGGNGTPNTTGNSNNTGSDNSNGSGQEGSQDCIQVGVDGGCIVEIITPLVLDYDDTIIDCIGYSSEITQLTLSQKSDLANFINTNGCTEENSEFITEAIDAYIDIAEIDFENEIIYYAGTKPLEEFDNKCNGIQRIWQLSGVNGDEYAGVLTLDGAILITQQLNPNGGAIGGIYNHNGNTYYQYPISQGPPSRTYPGQFAISGRYFIPIAASIHSHTPCLIDNTDGITNNIINDDQIFANKYSNINHYIIGCNAIGQFNGASNQAFNINHGALSSTCNNIN